MIENSLSVEGPKCDFHTLKIYGGASRDFFFGGEGGGAIKKDPVYSISCRKNWKVCSITI